MKYFLFEQFVGTAFLTCAVKVASTASFAFISAPIAIGLTLMICIYIYGHISGAMFNPSVKTGVAIREY